MHDPLTQTVVPRPMRTARVCVIIPVYNGARFLAEAIRSVQAQGYRDFSIIVVDDGSKDGSAEIAAGFSGVSVIRQANAGVSAARNRGLAETESEYIVFLDSDDRLLPGALEAGVRLLDERAALGFVYGHCEVINAEGVVQHANAARVERADLLTLLAGDSLLPPATAMFRRTVFERVGGFDTRLALSEDHELYLRAAAVFPIHCHNQVIVQYRVHGSNVCFQSAARTLSGVLRAMELRLGDVRGHPERERAYAEGRRHWARLFGPRLRHEVIGCMKARNTRGAARALVTMLRLYPRGLMGLSGGPRPRAAAGAQTGQSRA